MVLMIIVMMAERRLILTLAVASLMDRLSACSCSWSLQKQKGQKQDCEFNLHESFQTCCLSPTLPKIQKTPPVSGCVPTQQMSAAPIWAVMLLEWLTEQVWHTK